MEVGRNEHPLTEHRAHALQSCRRIDGVAMENNFAFVFPNPTAYHRSAVECAFKVRRQSVCGPILFTKGSEFTATVEVGEEALIGCHLFFKYPRYYYLVAYIVVYFSSRHHNRISNVVKEIV